mmetsp:Transcript_12761/g.24522  ORF Transcript_12761/g.24522 Transcript_12761/m.24522 type:complete len:201 (-) Transcript_12761:340-942(-)
MQVGRSQTNGGHTRWYELLPCRVTEPGIGWIFLVSRGLWLVFHLNRNIIDIIIVFQADRDSLLSTTNSILGPFLAEHLKVSFADLGKTQRHTGRFTEHDGAFQGILCSTQKRQILLLCIRIQFFRTFRVDLDRFVRVPLNDFFVAFFVEQHLGQFNLLFLARESLPVSFLNTGNEVHFEGPEILILAALSTEHIVLQVDG